MADASAQQGSSSGALSGRLPRLKEVWDQRDDWTGITDPAERKKRQNRLNQRNWRKRRHNQTQHSASADQPGLVAAINRGAEAATLQPEQRQETGHVVVDESAVRQLTHLIHVCPRRRAKVYRFMQQAYHDYAMHAPRPTYLPLLVRLNVLQAIARNATALGFPAEGLCNDDLVSPFNTQGPGRPGAPGTASWPRDLRPTALQVSLTHHPWIDLLPIPALRDNALRAAAAGLIDEDELCGDLLDVVDGTTERASLIVWGESWDIRGWEASIPFLRKWGSLLRGCPEIVEATNYWRSRRGEQTLAIKL